MIPNDCTCYAATHTHTVATLCLQAHCPRTSARDRAALLRTLARIHDADEVLCIERHLPIGGDERAIACVHVARHGEALVIVEAHRGAEDVPRNLDAEDAIEVLAAASEQLDERRRGRAA